jgi:hypothetical protein
MLRFSMAAGAIALSMAMPAFAQTPTPAQSTSPAGTTPPPDDSHDLRPDDGQGRNDVHLSQRRAHGDGAEGDDHGTASQGSEG